ncbi:MAG TPA: helix-turn-helix domain-containing protein [Dehalococcoidia bacterium]|nr:helix-turn-helix domain-containing protein [Dehalococcoidia bacterium]
MPIRINGQTYYRTAETCQEIGISRATLYRWLRKGLLVKSYKDRRGWRLFTEDDLHKLNVKAMEVQIENIYIGK